MAYRNCKFCGGRGCLACPGEKERDDAKLLQPLFVAKTDEDLKLLKNAVGLDAIKRAYEPGVDPMETALTGRGGGARTLEQNLIVAEIIRRVKRG